MLEPSASRPDAPGYGMRLYSATLHDVRGGHLTDACFHYANRPYLLGRVRPIARCEVSYNGFESVRGSVWIADGACGACRGQSTATACSAASEAPDGARHLDGEMAIDVLGLEALRQQALDEAGDPPHGTSSLHARSRAALRLGMPLRGYERCRGEACELEQEELLRHWTSNVLQPKLSQLEGERDGVHASFDFEPYRKLVEMREIVPTDTALAALPLPIGFVDLSLAVHGLTLPYS